MKARHVCDTVKFMHKYGTQPALTPVNGMCKAAHNLIWAMQGKINTLGDDQRHDLQCLSAIYKDVAPSEQQDMPDNEQPNLAPAHRVQQ